MTKLPLPQGIRSRVTLVVVCGSLLVSVIVVVVTAFAMQSLLENIVSNDLNDHLDKAQVEVELGNYQQAVQYAGSDIMQVIGSDGGVLASSAIARGLESIVDEDDDDADTYEVLNKQLHESYARIRDVSEDVLDGTDEGDEGSRETASSVGAEESGAFDDAYVDASSVLGQEGPYLVMKRKVSAPSEQVTLAAMTSLAPAIRSAQVAGRLIAVVMAVLLLCIAWATWRLTAHTLRPVEEMRASVEAINASDLSVRIPVPEHDRDLAPLASTFNDLLGRIEQALDRQKRFISDASHELKSPVAATGVMLEALREYPEAVDTDQVLGDLESENDRMARIVRNMLVLARHDEDRTVIQSEPVDLMDVLREESFAMKKRSDVSIDLSGVQPIVLNTDREQLGLALHNLLDNAVRYAASEVKLACEQDGDVVRIVVSDDGPGIPEADRLRAFERFVRLEDETQRKKDSTGLGLAVVKSAVEDVGGSVKFTDSELGGATAVIELPVAGL